MATNTDLERSFYGANLGLTEQQIAGMALGELRTNFLALAFVKPPNPKPTVTAITSTGIASPAATLYNTTDQTALANAVLELKADFNTLRTALISAGLIQ